MGGTAVGVSWLDIWLGLAANDKRYKMQELDRMLEKLETHNYQIFIENISDTANEFYGV